MQIPDPNIPDPIDEADEMIKEAIKVVLGYDKASASLLQRRLSLGYNRAARILDQLCAMGVISAAKGAMPRDVLIKDISEVSKIVRPYDPETGIKEKKPQTLDLTFLTKTITQNLDKKSLLLGIDKDHNPVQYHWLEKGSLVIAGQMRIDKTKLFDSMMLSLLGGYFGSSVRLLICDNYLTFSLYVKRTNLLHDVIIQSSDMGRSALKWLMVEINSRMKRLSELNIRDYQELAEDDIQDMPPIVVFINLYRDYIDDKELKEIFHQILYKGSMVGIHCVIGTDFIASLSKEVRGYVQNYVLFNPAIDGDYKALGVTKWQDLGDDQFVYVEKRKTIGVYKMIDIEKEDVIRALE